MQKLWTPEGQRLLQRLKQNIVTVFALERLEPYLIFYIKEDWYNYGMGSVILLEDESVREEAQEKDIWKMRI